MSSYPPALGSIHSSQAGARPDAPRGLAAIEERIDQIETELGGLYENLSVIQGRLSPPGPQPVNTIGDGSKSPSIENSLNRVLTHVQQLRRMSSEILHG